MEQQRCHGCGNTLEQWETTRRLLIGAVEPVSFCIGCDNDYLQEELEHNSRRNWQHYESLQVAAMDRIETERNDAST